MTLTTDQNPTLARRESGSDRLAVIPVWRVARHAH